jgi:hypothetical protein
VFGLWERTGWRCPVATNSPRLFVLCTRPCGRLNENPHKEIIELLIRVPDFVGQVIDFCDLYGDHGVSDDPICRGLQPVVCVGHPIEYERVMKKAISLAAEAFGFSRKNVEILHERRWRVSEVKQRDQTSEPWSWANEL